MASFEGNDRIAQAQTCPDYTMLGFHLSAPLNGALRGHQFNADDDMKVTVHDWFHPQPKHFL
jgi:hypothetical protein